MKKHFPIFLYLSVLALFIYWVVHGLIVQKDLRKGELIKNVYIKSSYYYYKYSQSVFSCVIIIDGREKTLSISTDVPYKTGRYLVDHYFPAMYSKKYNRMHLLILPEDFKKYGKPYPDSLRWVDSLNKRQ